MKWMSPKSEGDTSLVPDWRLRFQCRRVRYVLVGPFRESGNVEFGTACGEEVFASQCIWTA